MGGESNISRFYNKYIYDMNKVGCNKYFRVNLVHNNKSYYFESKDRK